MSILQVTKIKTLCKIFENATIEIYDKRVIMSCLLIVIVVFELDNGIGFDDLPSGDKTFRCATEIAIRSQIT